MGAETVEGEVHMRPHNVEQIRDLDLLLNTSATKLNYRMQGHLPLDLLRPTGNVSFANGSQI